jgi:hypothetical protein
MSNTPRTQEFTLKRIIENLGNIPPQGFSQETPKLTPEQKNKLMEMAGQFEQYGEAIRREEAIVNSARAMNELCELAEMYAVNECGDWFAQEIVKKDMKSLKQRVMEYGKCAKEAYARMQNLGVLYEDIGHILGRYYDLKGMKKPTSAAPADPSARQQPQPTGVSPSNGAQSIESESQDSSLNALRPSHSL